ncbi:Panacea domain-containing protein [Fructilactobacillus fructivorans]|uniref:GepA n=1 Tax=Fructilactobacillus fructivorans TaxID=1614 RepID=A0A0C1M7D6_9LACO|nr:type II toxin-antitoxin system antitoxin SocA domain-containing protein [Fructilactobacillus fructivorans]KID42329.1 GepA [Fructilactobacillus fructivorans]MCT0151053.1 DUF4065 domain-containing protein [Fructilactobacillus fructivorans]MCT2867389.1 DUF4065 domain-containing protein [Fructilactobacillus fructivorans]MCT2869092.1 DUF4065 domain-containing protein [Fructilactobacillus fructivorans]MCT2873188.1 DUF4065 domain-containing protein [Fructilactobacillus fructivorans]
MYIHLIVYSRISGKKFAYQYVTKNVKQLSKIRKLILENAEKCDNYDFSMHTLQTDENSFESVVKLDPYFKDSTVFTDIESFFKSLNDSSKLTALDVGSYLLRKFSLNSFPLQKILYYIYADYLEQFKEPLFEAKFEAWNHGPVEHDVYTKYKHDQPKLLKSVAFEQKISNSSNQIDLIRFINSEEIKYAPYYGEDAWESNDKNLTHKANTPWSRARDRDDNNENITDEDILNYHYIEKA